MEQINIQPLVESMHEFGICLDQETDAVLNNNFENYEALIESKQRHYAHYHSMVKSLANNLQQGKLDAQQKAILTNSKEILTDKLIKNDDVLTLVDEVSGTMVNIFKEALIEAESKADYYDNYGNEKSIRSSKPSSLTFTKDI